MFETLSALLNSVASLYTSVNGEWTRSNDYSPINLRKRQVADILENVEIWNHIRAYRKFLVRVHLDIDAELSKLELDGAKVSSRVKNLNSIQSKLERYNELDSLKGKVAINKCFNDLMGIRIVIDDNFSHGDVIRFFEENVVPRYPKFRLTDSTKNGYVASHIYVQHDNSLFPWEIQIWIKANEKSNLDSHKLYKQGYTNWEELF